MHEGSFVCSSRHVPSHVHVGFLFQVVGANAASPTGKRPLGGFPTNADAGSGHGGEAPGLAITGRGKALERRGHRTR